MTPSSSSVAERRVARGERASKRFEEYKVLTPSSPSKIEGSERASKEDEEGVDEEDREEEV